MPSSRTLKNLHRLPLVAFLLCTVLGIASLPSAAAAKVVVRQLATPIPDLAARLVRPSPDKLDIPGEFLLLPAFEVEANNASGATTLFAVRNITTETHEIFLRYFTQEGALQTDVQATLAPKQTHTVNVRDVPGLATGAQGIKRGYVQIVVEAELGDPAPAPILVGDYFQVTTGENFAHGERLLNFTSGAATQDACLMFDIRFLNGGIFDSGTEFTFYVNSPQGPNPPEDPPTLEGNVYNEAGALVGSLQIFTDENSFKLRASDLTPVAFGSFEIGFNNTFGHVAAAYDADDRFSVGLNGACVVPLTPVPAGQ